MLGLSDNNDSVSFLANEQVQKTVISYEKLGIDNINFSFGNINPTRFKGELDRAYTSIYKHYLGIILVVGIPMTVLSNAISLLLEVLVLALLIKFIYSTGCL